MTPFIVGCFVGFVVGVLVISALFFGGANADGLPVGRGVKQ